MEIEMVVPPKISVLMSVYNGERYLHEAIGSILNQTFDNFEFIIINDASTDSSSAIIDSFHDTRVVHMKNEQNLGLTKSLNKAILFAKGEYIARMDADDISVSERFQKQVDFLDQNPDYGICGTWTKIINDLYEPFKFPEQFEEIKFGLLSANCLVHPTVMWRNSFFKEHNLFYNEDFVTAQDYELWSRVVQKIKAKNIAEYLLLYRVHEEQVSLQGLEKQNHNATEIKIRQLPLLELSPTPEELISHLCIFDGQFNKYRGANEVRNADLWMHKIFLQNKKLNIYDEQIFLNFWKSKLFGNSLYYYDLKIWKVLKNSKCLLICTVPFKSKAKQFLKCLIKWSINKR